MKKLLLSVVVIGWAIFGSCAKEVEKQPETEPETELLSLEGTEWTNHVEYWNGDWSKDRLVFTATHATFTSWSDDMGINRDLTGRYIYDPPTVQIIEDPQLSIYGYDPNTGELLQRIIQMKHEGTIRGDTMNIGIEVTLDELMLVELKLRACFEIL